MNRIEIKPGSGDEYTLKLQLGPQAVRDGGGWIGRWYWVRDARGVWVGVEK